MSARIQTFLMSHAPGLHSGQGVIHMANQPTTSAAWWAMFSPNTVPGSARYGRNLNYLEETLQRQYGGQMPQKVTDRIAKVRAQHDLMVNRPGRRFAGQVFGKSLGPLIAVGGAAMAFTGEGGSIGDRTAEATGTLAGAATGYAGGKAGALIGGTIGALFSPVGVAVGAAIGGLIGGIGGYSVGSSAVAYGYDFANRLVDNEKRKRGVEWSDWAGQTRAFDTQRAHTMRQRSLEAMNRGMMNSRSLMGREAAFMHR